LKSTKDSRDFLPCETAKFLVHPAFSLMNTGSYCEYENHGHSPWFSYSQKSRSKRYDACSGVEVPPRFELGVELLQSSALPLGYGTGHNILCGFPEKDTPWKKTEQKLCSVWSE
jgi:hypothetical protein